MHRHFSAWNYDNSAQEGTEAYYSKQLYDNGAKCWNGPNRSVKVRLIYPLFLHPAMPTFTHVRADSVHPVWLRLRQLLLSCAKENELLSIVEAEKCEYVFRATTPALCWPEEVLEKEKVEIEAGKSEL
jgi:protein kinase C substrate 80K-H